MIRAKLSWLWPIALAAALSPTACAKPEDPARVELRNRLKQTPQLSLDELGRVLDEVNRSLTGKVVRLREDGNTTDFTAEQKELVLGMLDRDHRVGVFDEALRNDDGTQVRVINAPAVSNDPEYEATRRLLIDVETFLPRRFEFSFGPPGMSGYSLDLVVQ